MIRYLVQHYTTVFLLIVGVAVFGMHSYLTLPRESSPDITIPVVLVSTPYVGVSPEDIEGLVTIPLENELTSLRDVKVMKSTSAEGFSMVSIEFEPDVVIEEALQKVRDRVNRARPKLPDDVEEPSVREISFSDIPVIYLTIAGDGHDEEALKRLAERLEDKVSRIPGVLEGKITGGLTREIQVQVLPDRLNYYQIALHDVTGAIAAENVNIPGGTVEAGRGDFLLRVPGEFTDPRQIEQVGIKRVGDRPVLVKDVARVVDTFKTRDTYSRMNGIPSVTLAVSKRGGANILEVATAVKDLAAESAESWPDGVTYRVLADQSRYVLLQVSDLQNNIITALLLVLAVIVAFMGLRQSLFVALAIPLSMLMGFMALDAFGFTLNMVVLFSLILALGMLVDNAIVVVENIYRHMEEGKDRISAAIDGTNEVGLAVAASTATTVAAFGPLVLWGGVMGEWMGFLPKTLITVLVCSLIVAVCFLPVVSSRFMPIPQRIRSAEQEEAELGWVMQLYKRVLVFSIDWRYLTAAAMLGLLVFTFAAYIPLNHGTEFFPDTEPDRSIVAVRAPEGTRLAQTDRIVRQVEKILFQESNIDVWVAETGVSGGGDDLVGSNQIPNEAKITIDFLPDETQALPGERPRFESTSLTIERVREQLDQISGAKVTIEKQRMGPPVGAPLSIEVKGDDYHEVGAVAQQLQRTLFRLAEQPPEDHPEYAHLKGISKLSDNYRMGRPEFRLRIDRDAAKRIGVDTRTVGNTLRTAVAGTEASALREGEEEHDIVVQLAPEYRSTLQSVLGIRLPGRLDTSPDTFPVPLSAVASYELAGGSGAISHVDQDLVITVSGDFRELEGLDYNENDVKAAVASVLADFDYPPGTHARIAGSLDQQQESTDFLIRAFFIAVALITLVLVTQFDSLALPVIIMATVVLSLIGVLWGLILTATPFGIIMTGIGVISLAGVVVNNAIVLLDYVQQLQDRGMDVRGSLIRAGITRFRPVMLTAITTTLGLVPMAIGVSIDFARLRLVFGSTNAQWWGPMAVAVIFGLSFATVLTLVMVPTLYTIYDDLRGLPAWAKGKLGARSSGGVAAVAKLLLAGLALSLSLPAQAASLEEAWVAAEQNNLDLMLVRESTVQAATLPAQAVSTLQPRVDFSATYVINQQEIAFDPAEGVEVPEGFEDLFPDSDPVVIQRKAFWMGELSVVQRFFSGRALPLLVGARKTVQAARYREEATRQQIKAGVAQAYYGVLAAREAYRVAEKTVSIAETQLELAERREAAGLDANRDVLRARLAVSQARRDLRAAAVQRAQMEEVLHRVTGMDRGEPLELPQPVQIPDSLEAAQALALTSRPDVAALEKQSEVAKAERTANTMEWMPIVDGQFTYNYDQNTGFNDQQWQWRASVRASWNLWDGGLRLARNRELASRQREAGARIEQQRQIAHQEIVVAWQDYERAVSALEAVAGEKALAEENLELAQRAFGGGGSTYLDVEQARLSMQSSELSEIMERMSRDLAAIQLLVATGTL